MRVEVVLGRQVDHRVAAPAELGGLTLHGAQHHDLELAGNPVGERRGVAVERSAQDALGQHGQAVAGVERESDAVLGVQGVEAATQEAAVGDVVVDQERVVQQLDGDCGSHDVPSSAPERLARREAQRGTDELGGTGGIVPDQVVEPRGRLAVGQLGDESGTGQVAVLGELRRDLGVASDRRHGSAATSSSSTSQRSGRLAARTVPR